MKPTTFHRYRKMDIVLDTFLVLAPPILTVFGILWLFGEDLLPERLTHAIASFTGWR